MPPPTPTPRPHKNKDIVKALVQARQKENDNQKENRAIGEPLHELKSPNEPNANRLPLGCRNEAAEKPRVTSNQNKKAQADGSDNDKSRKKKKKNVENQECSKKKKKEKLDFSAKLNKLKAKFIKPSEKKIEEQKRKERKVLLDNMIGQVVEDNAKPPNRFEILELLGKGGFGAVYLVRNLRTPNGPQYAMKMEPNAGQKMYERLQFEVAIMKELQDLEAENQKHFVRLVSRGQDTKFKFVVMELLGLSVYDVRAMKIVGDFSKSSSIRISMQTCEAVRDFHSAGLLHRDLKVQIKETMSKILGAKLRYRQKFRKRRSNLRFTGTLKYCAVAAHDGVEQAPKDDMESWLYMTLDVFKAGCLPWHRPKNLAELINLKKDFINCSANAKYKSIFSDSASCLQTVASYLRNASYETEINYELILQLLRTEAVTKKINLDIPFDWIVDNGNKKEEGPKTRTIHAPGQEIDVAQVKAELEIAVPLNLSVGQDDSFRHILEEVRAATPAVADEERSREERDDAEAEELPDELPHKEFKALLMNREAKQTTQDTEEQPEKKYAFASSRKLAANPLKILNDASHRLLRMQRLTDLSCSY